MRRLDASLARRWTAASLSLLALAACGKHYLKQYEFEGKTLALVYIDPPRPDLLGSWYDIDPKDNAIQAVVRAGATVAKEMEARRARARFDSAARQVDLAALVAHRTLERANRYLGTSTVSTPDGADFVLEIQMKSIGIDARSDNATYIFTRAEAVLLDRKTGREIWSEDVRGQDRMTPLVVGTRDVPSAIITAGTLHTVTVADFRTALEQLATFTSNLISDELREKLRDARDR
jgi:hypothetical protein